MSILSQLRGRKQLPLRDEVAAITKRLSDAPSETELRDGWDAALKAKWRDWFTQLDQQLARGQAPDRDIFTARAMDFDGVGLTELSKLAARIDLRVNKGERYSQR